MHIDSFLVLKVIFHQFSTESAKPPSALLAILMGMDDVFTHIFNV
jgi:hypothetical protein